MDCIWPVDILALAFVSFSLILISLSIIQQPMIARLDLGLIILTTWPFFTRRYDFIRERLRRNGGKAFRFRVLQHRIIALSGEAGRKMFFTTSGFSMHEGYRILSGGAPHLKDVTTHIQIKDMNAFQSEVDEMFVKRVQILLRRDRITEILPYLIGDLTYRMNNWSKEGKIDPFREINDLVFQMTIRFTTCHELAKDTNSVNALGKYYWNIEKSATPISLLFPWFPSRAKKAKEEATTALYAHLLSVISHHRLTPTSNRDAIDLLIAKGESDETIVGVIIGTIFTGMTATGATACWMLIYLGINMEWKRRAMEEFEALLTNRAPFIGEEFHRRLAAIPLSAWEDELPVVDLIIQETIRLTLSGSALRRNMANDISFEGMTIKRGEFLTYQIADAHLNSNIYSEPEIFDPDRFRDGREESRREPFGFLGWGAGRHMCAGTRMAKLELKLVLAFMLLRYKYEVVSSTGKPRSESPQPNRNDTAENRPLGETLYLKYNRVRTLPNDVPYDI